MPQRVRLYLTPNGDATTCYNSPAVAPFHEEMSLTQERVVQPGDDSLHEYAVRGGEVERYSNTGYRFVMRDANRRRYTDAQIDDYQGLPRRQFPWRPPVTLRVRARFSHPADQLKGTAGFGFWNDPFAMTGRRIPALPRAVWFFFASPPSDMALALNVPGFGWKAATLDAIRLPALVLAPAAPLAIALINLRPLYRWLWPPIQRALAIGEASLEGFADMTTWHDYRLEWRSNSAHFYVDDRLALETPFAPRGPLGFVMWLDNQYAIANPQGRFGWGVLDAPGEQWMAVEDFSIVSGS